MSTSHSKSDQTTCNICSDNRGIYVCPRCNITYCSVSCYKSEQHLQCSELFYEHCVKEELANQDADSDSVKKMMEILKQAHQNEVEEEEAAIDSDDDEMCSELAERLSGVNLDDSTEVWSKLTAAERKEFEKFLQSGEIVSVLPEWEPWWNCDRAKVAIINPNDDEETFERQSHCPQVPIQIPPLTSLTKVPPAPSVPYMLCNILLSYVLTTRWFKGQQAHLTVEYASTLMSLSSTLQGTELSSVSSVSSVMSAFLTFQTDLSSCSWLSTSASDIQDTATADLLTLLLADSVTWFNVKAALCDIQTNLQHAIQVLKAEQSVIPRFSGDPPSVKQLKLCAKKIAYYLSWTSQYGGLLADVLRQLQLSTPRNERLLVS